MTPRVLRSLGHAWGGPTWLVALADGTVVVRMAFDDAEALADDVTDLDEEVGYLRPDGALVARSRSEVRALVYRFGGWSYDGERVGAWPVWRADDDNHEKEEAP